MKYILAFAACIAVVSCVEPLKGERCMTGADCKPEECCRMDIASMRITGKCQPKMKAGGNCWVSSSLHLNTMHMTQCPCEDGFECKKREGVVHSSYKCLPNEGSGNGAIIR